MFLIVTMLGISLQWEADCQRHVEAAKVFAKDDIGILVTTRPDWLPRNLYKAAYKLGVSQRPALAEIYVHISDDGDIKIQGKTFTSGAAQKRLIELKKQITKVAGTDNVHVMFVVSDYGTVSYSNNAVYRQLHQFTNANGLGSGQIKTSEVLKRKQNLDPRNLMQQLAKAG